MNIPRQLARQYLAQHYTVGADGLLYTPLGRAARSTIRFGRVMYPAAQVIAEMQRLQKTSTECPVP
jgi:hypothetical protein